jgi:broad specificity phosphatase PhoE
VTIWLARHGETDDNAPPARVQGWVDTPLNARGREQARALAREVAGLGIAALYTSQLARARETAEIVGRELGIEPLVDERLAESNRGDWEGRLLEEIQREQPEAWEAWMRAGEGFRFPGGEALADHCARVGAALDDVGAGPLAALVVCHGGSIRCAFARHAARGLDAFHELSVPNAALMQLPL